MVEIYRLKKGSLESEETKLSIDFGLVFEEDGLFIIDLYVSESFNITEFVNNENNHDKTYTCYCKTDKNNKIEARSLNFKQLSPYESKLTMICSGSIIHTELKEHRSIKDEPKDVNPKLHYIELEGLQMSFTDVTEQIKARGGKKVMAHDQYRRDHTLALLVIDKFPYNQVFYKHENSNNVIVEFDDSSNNTLSYETFLDKKREYTSVLSFLNGAEVKIRTEFTGDYFYVGGKIDSEVSIRYSFKKIINSRYNRYINLTSQPHTLNVFLMFSFDKYRELNKTLDLNSIIFYLSNAEQSKGIEERFFIQIIAFERLASKYIETLKEKEVFASLSSEFEIVKEKLLNIIEQNKGIFGKHLNSIKGRIGDLNTVRRARTEEKFLAIIEDTKIELTPEIENLIRVVRHQAIHKGEVGHESDITKNCLLLDKLIRDIILNLVEYRRTRR